MLEYLQQLDEALFRFINQNLANPVTDWIFPLLNHAAPFVPLAVLGSAWLAYRNSRRLWLMVLLLVLGMGMGDMLVCYPLKQMIARPRPAAVMKDVRILASGAAGGYSFPSAHTTSAFLAAAILCSFFERRHWIFIGCAGLIGFARVYVGVHYPSDVLGSAVLGWSLGAGFLLVARRGAIYCARVGGGGRNELRPYEKICEICGLGKQMEGRAEETKTSGRLFPRLAWIPFLILCGIQLSRFIWAANTNLDAPLGSVWFWCLATDSSAAHYTLLRRMAQCWFILFGSSPLSLWAIPWTLQTLWLSSLGWLAWKYTGLRALWAVIVLAVFLPLVSELSFLGSPQQVFEDSDRSSSFPLQTLIFYTLLGSPLWISVFLDFRRHPWVSGFTVAGFILTVSFPSVPWFVLAFVSSGSILLFARRLAGYWSNLDRPEAGLTRFLLVIFIAYGGVTSLAVYNPRFLRKLDISIFPRNSPHYVQTGWREWVERIRPQLMASMTKEIWTDSSTSRDQIQYLVGRSFRVRGPEDFLTSPTPPPEGVLYIREVYLAQINPRVLFVGRRDDGLPAHLWAGKRELASGEIFRKGDPVRQFQLYLLPAGK